MGNSFITTDYINAKEDFIRWKGNIDETVDDYVLRKRKQELQQLVRTVIRDELSDFDKVIVEMRWYRNMTPNEISERLGVDRSTVTRHLEKINDTIYEKLKYAVEYRYGRKFSREAKTIIKSGDAYRCTVKGEDVSERIKQLRTNQFLTLKEVAALTGIKEKRLKEIEEKGTDMTMTELKKLQRFSCAALMTSFSARNPEASIKGGCVYEKLAHSTE